MRIRMWNAFASNNSGSYTLVGRFEREEDACALAERLESVFAAHQAWVESSSRDEAPLDVLAREEQLASVAPLDRHSDAWPYDGELPRALASGTQLLVHAPYTITMPRLLGELIYRRGGRVEVELDHAHHPLLLQLEVWAHWKLGTEECSARTRGFRRAVEDGAFSAALVPPRYADHEPWAPAFRWRDWEMLEVTIAPSDLVLAARLARELAGAHGVEVHTRVMESPHERGDPLTFVRELSTAAGRHRVILWTVGPDPLRTLRAVREVLGCELSVAKEKIAAAPTELVIDVDEADARAAVEVLTAAGCDAESIGPAKVERG